MRWIRQSTSVDLPIGPFLDNVDGFTEEGALTITQPDIRLKKNGGAWAQKAAAQTLTHEENGYYEVTLDATDTDTLGCLRVAVDETGALPVWEDFMVVPANVWDSLFGADLLQVDDTQLLGTAYAAPTVAGVPEVDLTHIAGAAVSASTAQLGVNVVQGAGVAWASGAITAAVIATGAIDADAIADNAIDAGAIAADAITAAKIADGAIDAATFATGAITAAAIAADAIGASELAADAVTEIQSGLATSAALSTVSGLVDDLESRLGTPSNLGSGATVAANLVDIEGQTDDIGTAGAGLTAVPWNAAWDADIESEVLDALNTILADSVPADGTIPTARQALYMTWQFLAERSVSGTTLTVKKADGSTALMTFTLSDATAPTSLTRTT